MHLDSYRPPYLGSPWRNLSFAVIPVALVAVGFGLAARSSTQPLPPAAPVASVQRSDKLYVEPVPPPPVVQVRTIPIVPDIVPPPQSLPPPSPPAKEAAAAAEEDGPDRVRASSNRVRSRGDICQRHGLRKVKVGRYRWRCR
jgi:hypothetical protein